MTQRYRYDAQGRTTAISQDRNGHIRTLAQYEYAGDAPRPSAIVRPSRNPNGQHRIELAYNAAQQPVSLTERGFNAIERTTRLRYDGPNLIEIDGPRTDVKDQVRLSYDRQQRLKTLTTPDGRSLQVQAYDAYGRPQQIQGAQRTPIQLTYDARGQITEVRQGGRAVSYAYDPSGALSAVTGPDGNRLSLRYDAAGRTTQMTGPRGRRLDNTLDSEGRLIDQRQFSSAGELVRTVSYLYDAQGRLSARQDNAGQRTQYHYDGNDQLSQVEDAQGYATDLSYNGLGQLLSLTQPGSRVTQFHYDRADQALGVTDARDNRTDRLKDDFGRVVQLRSPDTGVTTYRYDAAGNRTQKTNAQGQTTNYRWDAANRLIEQRNADGKTRLSYDKASGQLERIEGPDATEIFAYNTEGQLTTHTRMIDKQTFITAYRYDPDTWKLASKTLPDGQTLRYHYYAEGPGKGQLRAITLDALLGLMQTPIIGEIDHNRHDGRSGFTHGNGLRTDYRYAADGTLTAIQHRQTLDLQYHYDAQGRISAIDTDGAVSRYAYDPMDRLVQADTARADYRYQYDAVGNRTQQQVTTAAGDSRTTHYRYAKPGEGNRLTQREDEVDGQVPTETDDYTYNTSGSPTQVGALNYTYNSEHRPVKVYRTLEGRKTLLAEYAYNGFGERIKKVVYSRSKKPKVTYYLYDGHSLSAEANAAGDITAQYIYLKQQPVAKLDGGNLYAIHTDNRGAPRSVTDDQQAVVWSADYSPFGEVTLDQQAITLNLRLPGQYEDEETGKYYNYLRDYDPATGRYLTSDPIGLKGGLNTYAYVSNNPLALVDRLGLASDSAFFGGAADVGPGDAFIPKPGAGNSDTFVNKLGSVIAGSIDYVIDQGRADLAAALEELIKPENLAVNAALMAAFTGVQLIPGVNVAVDALMLGVAYWYFGSAGLDFADALIDIGIDIYSLEMCDPNANDNLKALSETFAKAVIVFGIEITDFFNRGKKLGITPNDKNWVSKPSTKSQAEWDKENQAIHKKNHDGKSERNENTGETGNWNKKLNKRPLDADTVYKVKTKADGQIEYHTDANGRVETVRTTIRDKDLDAGVRSCYQQSKVGNCGLDDDEGGHLIATKLGGPGEAINLVPQNMNLNRGKYREMEKEWAKAAAEGKEVDVAIKMKYDDPLNPGRPTSFTVEAYIDGIRQAPRDLMNSPGGL